MKQLILIISAILYLTTSMAQTNEKMEEKKILVAYFSATETTKTQAEAIAEATNGTLYEIIPATTYTANDLDWRDKQSRSTKEMNDEKCRPALGGKQINAENFDIIFLGYPIWWYVCPRIINTWIESQNLNGKTIILFATSGGSGIENSIKTLRNLYPNCNFKDGKLLNGTKNSAGEWAKSMLN